VGQVRSASSSDVEWIMKVLLERRGAILVREQAEKAKTQAREAVVLLERARTLLAQDNAVQLAMKHVDEAISEAERRAAMLENWYRRTYLPADFGAYESGM
jgi:N-acetylglutamate synthase-like GNAT family acetyltransferase